jgi:hypothetical protein
MRSSQSRSIRTVAVALGVTLCALGVGLGAQNGASSEPPKSEAKGPEQPVPFSHKLHLTKAGVSCKDCHDMPDPGDQMTLATADKCMTCHSVIKKDSPAIQKLATFKANKEDIPWKRIYQVPDFVYFSHKAHVTEGKLDCQECHGEVKAMEVMYKAKPTTMAACMDCHRTKNVSVACDFCHELQ